MPAWPVQQREPIYGDLVTVPPVGSEQSPSSVGQGIKTFEAEDM